MGSRKSRDFRHQQDREVQLHRLKNEPRPFGQPPCAEGIGRARVQLACCPSFAEATCWEICEQSNSYNLFRSKASRTASTISLVGFDQIEHPSSQLQHFVQSLFAINMPIAPVLTDTAGLDGVSLHLVLFGDLHSMSRFDWWSDPPPAWEPMVSLANAMLKSFGASNPT
jgi:hypothetical protein